MTRSKRSTRIKKTRACPEEVERLKTLALALGIIPASQVAHGGLVRCDVANHSDGDQRHSVRSGGTKTIRKMTRIDKLEARQVISKREALACTWYANAHAARYDTSGITAKYGESNGAACTNYDHLPKTRPQQIAYEHYDMARQAIPPMVRPMFEHVVIHGQPLGKLAPTFRYAARRLLEHIEGKVAQLSTICSSKGSHHV